ncbi:hypothetical protein GOODEAATRI_033928 [Goodea atripinnis]|uniref:Chemokine interleukin-8-like domain-containing protein n=1 Tax=Goodea atripinnis TaxID=208336 RepID=A0ABV0PJA4_9TELE
MKVAQIFLLCVLGAILVSTVLCYSSTGPDDCCFGLNPKPVNKRLITSYYKTDPHCPVSAVILITKRSRRICVDPKQPWVEKIINFLEGSQIIHYSEDSFESSEELPTAAYCRFL